MEGSWATEGTNPREFAPQPVLKRGTKPFANRSDSECNRERPDGWSRLRRLDFGSVRSTPSILSSVAYSQLKLLPQGATPFASVDSAHVFSRRLIDGPPTFLRGLSLARHRLPRGWKRSARSCRRIVRR